MSNPLAVERPIKGIIAGGGSLPAEIAEEVRSKGGDVFIIGIDQEAGENIAPYEHVIITWSEAGKIFEIFEARNVGEVVFAGSIQHRPDLSSLLNWSTLSKLPEVLSMMLGGDNTILSTCIRMFEKRGFSLVGAHDLAPGLLAPEGKVAGKKPGKTELINIECAAEAIRLLGPLDIGQAAVAENGRVVAVEGVEGTDLLLERVANLRTINRLPKTGKHGVLVKTAKPGQDMRADLPSIGPNTILNVKAAGLSGIVVEAGASLILSRRETLALARQEGVFIHGMERTTPGSGEGGAE